MKIVLNDIQIQYILKNKNIIINNKKYSFDKKAMVKFRKLVKLKKI